MQYEKKVLGLPVTVCEGNELLGGGVLVQTAGSMQRPPPPHWVDLLISVLGCYHTGPT